MGGAIRDFRVNERISDVDFVINTDVDVFVKKIANKTVKIRKVNFHYKTISLILSHKEYQITSFRKDLITFGRQAYVSSAESLYQDSLRRDFTVNALYLNEEGAFIDPLVVLQDLKKTDLKFICDTLKRIDEYTIRSNGL